MRLPALLGVVGLSALLMLAASAQQRVQPGLMAELPLEPAALVARITADIEAIRGLDFTREISVANQSLEEFEAYLSREMDRSLPPRRAEVFGRVVEKTGLYRGPRIDDAVELIKQVMSSQVAAYYDPAASEFRVLVGNSPPGMLGPLFAHELYHGLQDQYFDLESYLTSGLEAGLNDDELFARQAVVEGEATFLMTLWTMREATGQVPSGFTLALAMKMQSALDASQLQALSFDSEMSELLGEEFAASIAAMDEIPPFLIESLLGAYMKGMDFVYRVAGSNWDAAFDLYRDPPQSSEQILHPDKYLARDVPVSIGFEDFGSSDLLAGWALLDSNVLGEFQWRIIFDEFGMSVRSAQLAAGWDGDRYAVYEQGDELLMLLYTSWDSEADASEFALAYQELLKLKYPVAVSGLRVAAQGNDVLIVEGGDPRDTEGLIELLKGASRVEAEPGPVEDGGLTR